MRGKKCQEMRKLSKEELIYFVPFTKVEKLFRLTSPRDHFPLVSLTYETQQNFDMQMNMCFLRCDTCLRVEVKYFRHPL